MPTPAEVLLDVKMLTPHFVKHLNQIVESFRLDQRVQMYYRIYGVRSDFNEIFAKLLEAAGPIV